MYKFYGLPIVLLFTNVCNSMDLGDARGDFSNIEIPNVLKREKTQWVFRKNVPSNLSNNIVEDEEFSRLSKQIAEYKENEGEVELADEFFGQVLKKMKNK